MGRDQFVEVDHEGYLLPFGNRATLVVTSERRFVARGNGSLMAQIHRQQIIVVKEPEKIYVGDPGTELPPDQRVPFRSVRIKTLSTPPISNTGDTGPYVVLVKNSNNVDLPFIFHLAGVDRNGQVSEFTTPLAWVSVRVDPNVVSNFYKTDPTAAP